MTWTRDFTCNSIDCKNYKVKIDAMAANAFCESCATKITQEGICLSCGVEKVSVEHDSMFPWLCKECELATKPASTSMGQPSKAYYYRSGGRPSVRQNEEAFSRQLPGPVFTLVIILMLSIVTMHTESKTIAWFLVILILLFSSWMPIALIAYFTHEEA